MAEKNNAQQRYFTEELLRWHEQENERSFPWQEDSDPYKIWLSEIIMQQTRVAQGLPYYLRFIEKYPTVHLLARAADDEVFRLWQGLGYYNRCKNLLHTARAVSALHGGSFPKDYEGLRRLKGIGEYTAAAIASFAYGLPHAVVDGNVYRVLARYFGLELATDTHEGKRYFQTLAGSLLPADHSAAYNQAIMDLGATVCTPKSPECAACPLGKRCTARREGTTALLPVKQKKTTMKTRHFNYLLLKDQNEYWVIKRQAKDIWQNLHEFFLIETSEAATPETLMATEQWRTFHTRKAPKLLWQTHQRLTHQMIETRFFLVEHAGDRHLLPASGFWVTGKALDKLAFPRTIVSFLEKKIYF